MSGKATEATKRVSQGYQPSALDIVSGGFVKAKEKGYLAQDWRKIWTVTAKGYEVIKNV